MRGDLKFVGQPNNQDIVLFHLCTRPALYRASCRLQFDVACRTCNAGGDHLGFCACAFLRAFCTSAHMRLTSFRFSRLRALRVDGSGHPCSLKSTSKDSSFNLGKFWINLMPFLSADSTQHGRNPQFMTRFSIFAYAAISALEISSKLAVSLQTIAQKLGRKFKGEGVIYELYVQPREIHIESARQFKQTNPS